MIVKLQDGSYFGIYKQIEELSDRLRCDNHTDLPYNVIGSYEILEDDSLMPPPPVPPRDILAEIVALEATITNRRQREAILDTDNGWLADVDSQIAALRALL